MIIDPSNLLRWERLVGTGVGNSNTIVSFMEDCISSSIVVQIGFNQTEYVVLEGDGVATVYVVVLQGDLQRSVSVTFSTIPGTATSELIGLLYSFS